MSTHPTLEQLAAAMRQKAICTIDGHPVAEHAWAEAAAMVDAHAQRVRQTAAAAVLEHMATIDRVLTPGTDVTLTPEGVADLRAALARVIEPHSAPASGAAGSLGQPGDRVEDGGIMGTLVRCTECGGIGVLHKPDELPPTAAPQPETPPTDVDVDPALMRDMQRIAQGYRGLAYDPDDRPEEVAAVIAAAKAAGLVPVPDPALFRAYRGCTPPEPAPAPVVDPVLAALAREAEQYRWNAPTGPVDEVLAVLATQARPLLEALYAADPNGSTR